MQVYETDKTTITFTSTTVMVTSDDIVAALDREDEYSYRLLLESVASASEPHLEKAINTLELFAFGDLASYTAHKPSFLDLLAGQTKKLAKLTLASACNENESRSVSFDALMHEYSLKQALDGNYEHLERLVMELVDENLIVARIDEQLCSVKFVESLFVRDAYNEKRYSLRVLSDGEVRKRSVTAAREFLQHWLDTKVVPAQAELKDMEGF